MAATAACLYCEAGTNDAMSDWLGLPFITELHASTMNPWNEILRVWTWRPGCRCLLAVPDSALELRIDRGPAVLRRARSADVEHALETPQQWRIDYEIHHTAAGPFETEDRCAVCGDRPVVELDPASGI